MTSAPVPRSKSRADKGYLGHFLGALAWAAWITWRTWPNGGSDGSRMGIGWGLDSLNGFS